MGSFSGLTASGQAASQSFSDRALDSVGAPCRSSCWIELELLYEDGTPVANEQYWLRTSQGDIRKGTLNERGMVRLEPIPCGLCLVRFPDVDDEEFVIAPQPGAIAPQPVVKERKDWIELELLDETGEPVGGQPFEVQDSAGGKHTGKLDAKGLARVEGLPPGPCLARFPSFDKRDWVS